MGWILINFEGQYFQILVGILQPLELFLLQMIIYTLPVILCGLMLGIASGVGRHAFLQIGLWAAAGGILGHLVTIPVRMVNTAIFARVVSIPRWESDLVGVSSYLPSCARMAFLWCRIGLRVWQLERLQEVCRNWSGCQCSWHPGWIFHCLGCGQPGVPGPGLSTIVYDLEYPGGFGRRDLGLVFWKRKTALSEPGHANRQCLMEN